MFPRPQRDFNEEILQQNWIHSTDTQQISQEMWSYIMAAIAVIIAAFVIMYQTHTRKR
jgi:uncharacterized membrane-anchored protein